MEQEGYRVPKAPKLSIVFLNYNRISETRRTLEHLRSLVGMRDDIEVVAVDNASVDGTGNFLKAQNESWLQVMHMPRNTGIAGYNKGFAKARGQYILVLDDDSHPHDSETLDRIIDTLDHNPMVGVVACHIETPKGRMRTWHLPEKLDQAGESMAFVGCGFAIRRSLFAEIGWYPENFFLYQNEMEVAIQVRRRGYSIHYDPQCRVVHREAQQGRPNWRRVYYPTRNTIWLIRRYFPAHSAIYMIASRLCFGFIRALQSRELKWYYKAVREAFNEPVSVEILSPELRRELRLFRHHNSLWHHMLGAV